MPFGNGRTGNAAAGLASWLDEAVATEVEHLSLSLSHASRRRQRLSWRRQRPSRRRLGRMAAVGARGELDRVAREDRVPSVKWSSC
jgi:hypothetical protein